MKNQDQKLIALLEPEIWKKVPVRYGNLSASNLGRIRNDNNGRIYQKSPAKNGYVYITMHANVPEVHVRAHRLVGLAFGIVTETEWINHKDGVKHNNRVDNLEKSNPRHNRVHAIKMGLSKLVNGEEHGLSTMTEEKVKSLMLDYKNGARTTELSKKYGIHQSAVNGLISGRSWKHLNPFRIEHGIKHRVRDRRAEWANRAACKALGIE